MKKLAIYAFAATMMLGLSNCKKEKEELTITIESPENGKTYPNSGELVIKGKVTAKEVDEVEIKIKNKSNNDIVYSWDKHVHAKDEYVINQKWEWNPQAVQSATMFELEVAATDDHDGDKKKVKVDFTIAP
jgi:hypothetical protein